ncbi:armadillo repeat-containing protein 8-like isoform X2 [Neocloeon triangulifer]|uniref:armadillo repeat-containing protein 8-like isoform X2 n=1 Tax=Neocloeon triangulifer TaxID=2078957 RepID=UPI00286F54D3|nr:armadillo repeat-containing protein 8-like isoform X2 [Neocloeon triangulifer]
MTSIMQPFVDPDNGRPFIEEIYSSDEAKCLNALICLKNAVIGSNRQKGFVVQHGVVSRLVQIVSCESSPQSVRIEATIILGSIAKGADEHVRALVEMNLIPMLVKGILEDGDEESARLVEASLCCLRTLLQSGLAPTGTLAQDSDFVQHLLALLTASITSQMAIATILTAECKTPECQDMLSTHGAVLSLTALLCSPHRKVQMPALSCLAKIIFQNRCVALAAAAASFGGKALPDLLTLLMAQDRPTSMQLASARCLTYLHRAGALSADDPKIIFRTLPCLVRLCHKEHDNGIRAIAAETLGYLTEVDTGLQRLASISNHLIPTLASYFRVALEETPPLQQQLRQAAFRAFASLGANDEDIRKKIIETEGLVEHIVCGLQDTSPSVRLAAIRCLHSLSRSVHQLRTTFQDHLVWKPLMNLLKHASDDDVVTVASSTLCNLLLEFSPSKEPILELGAIDLLCGLTRRKEAALRLNGIWALMNMAFQAEQKIKSQILKALGTEQIFRLLSDPEVNVLMKTLGLLRNLLSTKPHIDQIMNLHGIQIMQAVILILEGNHSAEVKEQALCILANIADGDSAKDFIMTNEDVLKKLASYMMHSNVKLQVAAIFCVSNLVWKDEIGASDRQARLKELGVHKLLQQLINTSDTLLFDKVKTAMTQFSDS